MDKRRVIQLMPTLTYGDAVGNDALAIHEMLQSRGIETALYAEHVQPRLLSDQILPFSDWPGTTEKDVILYHGSTGTELNDLLPTMPGTKVMIYHNITPPAFFDSYSPQLTLLTSSGYAGMCKLRECMDFCIADSAYNALELTRMGYTCPIEVCPILIPFSDYEQEPDSGVIARYGQDGWMNLLFVGRIAPNKKQEDVIRSFCCYQRRYNPKSRLFLVGSSSGLETYAERLQAYVEKLGLTNHVFFTGHISFQEILAYYQLADAFICMSEHEGFCVPIVEAMYFGKPILAYAAAAVPETLGDGGLLMADKDPEVAAAAIHRLTTDGALQKILRQAQVEQLKGYQYEPVQKQLWQIFEGILGKQ